MLLLDTSLISGFSMIYLSSSHVVNGCDNILANAKKHKTKIASKNKEV
jgi:hypothetical protein